MRLFHSSRRRRYFEGRRMDAEGPRGIQTVGKGKGESPSALAVWLSPTQLFRGCRPSPSSIRLTWKFSMVSSFRRLFFNQDGDPFLFQLYRRFGCSVMIEAQVGNGVGGSSSARYDKKPRQNGHSTLWITPSQSGRLALTERPVCREMAYIGRHHPVVSCRSQVP
jgi:hypothetical protein